MKKIYTTLVAVIAIAQFSSAQTNTLPLSGNVGIGTTSPADLLHINVGTNRKGITITSDGDVYAYTDITLAISNTGSIATGAPIGWDISHRKDGYFSNTPSGQSSLEFYAYLQGGNYYAPLCFKPDGNVILVSNKNALSGNVGIGTTSPDQKLTVNGTIHSSEVKVDTSIPVPDYVFEPAYKLPQLSALKTYLDANHHLPEIPSAVEIEKYGLNLGEMNIKLLKKVEELTLYLIEQKEQLTNQQKINKSLQKQINKLAKAHNK